MTSPEPRARHSNNGATSLSDSIREYWNARIHDLDMARSPVGSAAFFRELDAYRFEKLDYLPRLVDFNGYRGLRVLEIGCGVGTDLARFARGGAHVTGIDLSETAINLAHQNLESLALKGDLRVGDGGSQIFQEQMFDLVYCHGVLQYAADPEGIVRETHRVLRPDGTAIFMVYNRDSWLAWMSRNLGIALEHGDAPICRLSSTSEFEALLRVFPRRTIVPERFPVTTKLHRGVKGILYNGVFVPAFRLVPRMWVQRWGWHLMAFCRKK